MLAAGGAGAVLQRYVRAPVADMTCCRAAWSRMCVCLLRRYAELLALAEARHAIVMPAYRIEDDTVARDVAAGAAACISEAR